MIANSYTKRPPLYQGGRFVLEDQLVANRRDRMNTSGCQKLTSKHFKMQDLEMQGPFRDKYPLLQEKA